MRQQEYLMRKIKQTKCPSKTQSPFISANSHSLPHRSHCSEYFTCTSLEYSYYPCILNENMAQRVSKPSRSCPVITWWNLDLNPGFLAL